MLFLPLILYNTPFSTNYSLLVQCVFFYVLRSSVRFKTQDSSYFVSKLFFTFKTKISTCCKFWFCALSKLEKILRICSLSFGQPCSWVDWDECDPSKHETSTQCWTNIGTPTTTLAQHRSSIGSMSRACWVGTAIQTQYLKFESWRSAAEHAIFRSPRLPTVLNLVSG